MFMWCMCVRARSYFSAAAFLADGELSRVVSRVGLGGLLFFFGGAFFLGDPFAFASFFRSMVCGDLGLCGYVD